jgi:TorA maturation chaperone TorD
VSGTAAIATARGHVYEMLATVFRRPLDAQRLKSFRTAEMLAAMSATGNDPGDDFINGDDGVLLDRLAIDFTQLFHGPGERIAPYEGIQLGDSEELMGTATNEVRRFMAEVGFIVPRENGELPDHISVELTFMAELARREAEALEAGDDKTAKLAASLERRFLTAHLGRWAEGFAREIKKTAETPFYRAMAELLADFVASEQDAATA